MYIFLHILELKLRIYESRFSFANVRRMKQKKTMWRCNPIVYSCHSNIQTYIRERDIFFVSFTFVYIHLAVITCIYKGVTVVYNCRQKSKKHLSVSDGDFICSSPPFTLFFCPSMHLFFLSTDLDNLIRHQFTLCMLWEKKNICGSKMWRNFYCDSFFWFYYRLWVDKLLRDKYFDEK